MHPSHDQEALEHLQALIDGYIMDCQHYTHSLTGTVCKCVNKECNWTVMYSALFDAGILEQNEGLPQPLPGKQ